MIEGYHSIISTSYDHMFTLIRDIISEHVSTYNMGHRPDFRRYNISTHKHEVVSIFFFGDKISIMVHKFNWIRELSFRCLSRMIIKELKERPITIRNTHLIYPYHINVRTIIPREEKHLSIVYDECIFDFAIETTMYEFNDCIFKYLV